MTKARERAIKMYWGMAKEKCPFQTEEIVNGYLEGFIDCAELFEEEDKLSLTKYSRIIIDKKDECIAELEEENNKHLDVINNQDVKIADLEKENAELKSELTKKADTNHSLVEQMAKLEEENAEWEKFVKDIQNRNEENYLKVCHKLTTELNRGIELADQLTKAKEIIKELVRVEYADFTNGDYSNELSKVLEQAEQFLKADVGTKNYEEQDKILKTRLL